MSTSPRDRNARAVANDAAIASAAVSEVLRVGVDRVSLREVAQRAGLTHGATYARYEDVSELLVDLWQSKLSTRAAELLELSTRAVEERSECALEAFFDRVRQPHPEDIAMAEILLASRRMPILFEEIEIFLKKNVYPGGGLTEESKSLSVRTLSLFGLAIRSALEGHYFNDDQKYLEVVQRVVLAVLTKVPGAHLGSAETVTDGLSPSSHDVEDVRARLAHATFVVVAKSGYHEATVSRIARRADCSPGSIYKIYRSKQDLVLDSFRTIFETANGPIATGLGLSESGLTLPALVRWSARRYSFSIEMTIAAAHEDSFRTIVRAHLADPERQMSRLGDLDDVDRAKMSDLVRSMAALAHGAQWMSAVMPADTPDFDQFSESFRVALSDEWTSTEFSFSGKENDPN
ncbi:MAG: TetR family transcriptional regulator [Acidimicrobiales bacterium]